MDAGTDVIVVSCGSDGASAVAAVRRIREDPATRDVGILAALTGGGAEARAAALRAGADDAVTLPAAPEELAARAEAVRRRIRRAAGAPDPDLVLGVGIAVDLGSMRLRASGVHRRLQPVEARMLALLIRARGGTVARERLAALAGCTGHPRAVDVHVWRLRRALEGTPAEGLLLNERGEGYRMAVRATPADARAPRLRRAA
jgi:DNA-binding response OmpR family regulator